MQYSTLESKCKGKDNADNPLLFFIQTYCLLDLLPHFLNNIRFIFDFFSATLHWKKIYFCFGNLKESSNPNFLKSNLLAAFLWEISVCVYLAFKSVQVLGRLLL